MTTLPIPLEGRRVVLIGGAGFIGHTLALELKRQGAQVEVVDSLQVNNLLTYAAKMPELLHRDLYLKSLHQRLDLLLENEVPLHVVDARDYAALNMVLDEADPQVIVHLAAVAHAGKSNKDPYSTFDHSLRTLENALDYARSRVEHFLFFSSSMVYGDFQSEAVSEEHPLEPKGIYGALKLAGEKLIIAYNQVFDLSYTIIRPSALYGPRCVSRRVGQVFIENALDGAKLQVDGNGAEKLDFTFIEDLVVGVRQAIEHPAARNQVLNLTYGEARSILDLLEVIRSQFPEVEVEFRERDKLMPVRGTLSVTKARELIGYEPRHPIEVGFPKYIHWYKDLTAGKEPRVRLAK